MAHFSLSSIRHASVYVPASRVDPSPGALMHAIRLLYRRIHVDAMRRLSHSRKRVERRSRLRACEAICELANEAHALQGVPVSVVAGSIHPV